jgi:DNA-binding transcriptional LysR family regulator
MAKASLRKLGFDLQALEVFVAVCRSGSMTVAAGELGLTQPAISRAVALLEEKLEVPLFKRDTRPLVATAAGHRLNDTAERLLTEALALPGIVRGRSRRKLPQLRLGVLDSLSDPFVPLVLKSFREIASAVTVVTGFDDFLRQNMLKHEYDAVVSTSAFDDIAGFEQFELFRENYIIVAPASASAFTDEASFKQFAARLPLIRLGNTSSMARSIERHLRRMRLSIPETLSCNTVESVVGMVAAGVGWAILTPVCVRKCLHSISQLQLLPMPGQTFSRRIFFAARKNELSPFTSQAADICRNVIRDAYLPGLKSIAPWMDGSIALSQP